MEESKITLESVSKRLIDEYKEKVEGLVSKTGASAAFISQRGYGNHQNQGHKNHGNKCIFRLQCNKHQSFNRNNVFCRNLKIWSQDKQRGQVKHYYIRQEKYRNNPKLRLAIAKQD